VCIMEYARSKDHAKCTVEQWVSHASKYHTSGTVGKHTSKYHAK